MLRNNDLGDLLVITPLFAALRQRFPEAKIIAGVGSWALPILAHNPHLSGTLTVNAPWFNKGVQPQGWRDRWHYLQHSEAVAQIAAQQFDIGIDVLGSNWGALLLLRAGIPYRLGVRGFAGGAAAMQQCIRFDPQQRVSRAVLGFAELLGATELPDPRPQLFLTPDERRAGEQIWTGRGQRVAIAPGSGREPRYWGEANWQQLVARLAATRSDLDVVLLGGPQDVTLARNWLGWAPIFATLLVACHCARRFRCWLPLNW
ncbi:MAG: glycosyltransferase family 9 protein [Spirulinaceae cyanobacterium RM2_2_10]|nr:glycosyltransferase family 9 protein [Spirulinaceae cyanobacterium RM2_2_10]